MLAQNLARTGDETAAQVYADLIARALNQEQTSFDHLPYWFESKASDLDLYSVELEPPEGFYNSALLQIEGPGSIFLWLLEGPGAYQVYPLAASFDPASPTPMRALLSDLTGDGSDEVIIFPAEDLVAKTQLLDNDAFLVPLPRIFDLTQVPAEEYSFQVGEDQINLGIEFANRWSIQVDEENPDRLVFSGQAFPACPLNFEFVYQWNGSIMERTQTSYDVAADEELDPHLPGPAGHCRRILGSAGYYKTDRGAPTLLAANTISGRAAAHPQTICRSPRRVAIQAGNQRSPDR